MGYAVQYVTVIYPRCTLVFKRDTNGAEHAAKMTAQSIQ